jgi:hypothetical protein
MRMKRQEKPSAALSLIQQFSHNCRNSSLAASLSRVSPCRGARPGVAQSVRLPGQNVALASGGAKSWLPKAHAAHPQGQGKQRKAIRSFLNFGQPQVLEFPPNFKFSRDFKSFDQTLKYRDK